MFDEEPAKEANEHGHVTCDAKRRREFGEECVSACEMDASGHVAAAGSVRLRLQFPDYGKAPDSKNDNATEARPLAWLFQGAACSRAPSP